MRRHELPWDAADGEMGPISDAAKEEEEEELRGQAWEMGEPGQMR